MADTFFSVMTVFALLMGIGALVCATEVTKRCTALIDEKFSEINADLNRRLLAQDADILELRRDLRERASGLETILHAQMREISMISKSIEPLIEEKRLREEKEKAGDIRYRR